MKNREVEVISVVVPDWEARLKALKIILSLIPKERREKIVKGLKLKDEDILKRLKEAISETNRNELRWGMHKKRFFILARDKFTCHYCGRKPPEVILEVDHIKPIAKGGDNGNDNLLTACRDCNMGKGTNEY